MIRSIREGDRVVDALDIATLAQIVAGWSISAQNSNVGDVNADGTVDAFDISLMAQAVAGWNVALQYGGTPAK